MHELSPDPEMQSSPETQSRRPVVSIWLKLVTAGALLLFANGANTIPIAAWLSPLFLLSFARSVKPWLGLPAACAVLAATFAFQFRGMVPIPGIGWWFFLACYSALLLLPYLADRWIRVRTAGFAATLAFPATWAATEYLTSLGPFGSWCSAAYSQYGNLPLLQVLSVTGLWGITFLIGWVAAAANHCWEAGWDSRRARRGAWTVAAVLLAVLLTGGGRLALLPPASATVRVASLSRGKVQPELRDETFARLLTGRASKTELEEVRTWGKAVNDDLLARTELEAQSGARIIFWGEANAVVFKEDETEFVARGGRLAQEHGIYLGMAMASWRTGKQPPLENKIVLLKPDGKVAWEFVKARPVPGGEAAISLTTDGKLRSLDTPHGRLSAVICFDADFPGLLAQAGSLGTDLLLDPSNDWRAIDPWHTQMASFRAVEQGVNFVRHTSRGLSAAYDYQGRCLAAMDHYTAAQWNLVAQVPTRGVRTLYSRFGDWFAWLCLAIVAGLGVSRSVASRKSHYG